MDPEASPLPTHPRPIRLVYVDDNGDFCMDAEAMLLLQLLKGPVAVVSVGGRARQGKSFLLNQLLERSTGFPVASTHEPHTKGLWLWSEPIKSKFEDGSEYSIMLIDSQGINSYDMEKYIIDIYSLAVRLSSTFIYNQMGGIEVPALDRLSQVSQLTELAHTLQAAGSSASEIWELSPMFIWLQRDFYLDLGKKNITPQDYLERALNKVQSKRKRRSSENEISETITRVFPNRQCFTLVRPSDSEDTLRTLDKVPFNELRRDYTSGVAEFRAYVLRNTLPKTNATNSLMNGPSLVDLTLGHIKALNNMKNPYKHATSKLWSQALKDQKNFATLAVKRSVTDLKSAIITGRSIIANLRQLTSLMENTQRLVHRILEGNESELAEDDAIEAP